MSGAPMADDLEARLEALRGAEEGDGALPALWTPEHVRLRLVDGFDVLRRERGARVGPVEPRAAWPSVLQDVIESFDAQTWAQKARDAEEWARRRGERPTSLEIWRSDQALSWAATYLADQPLAADALQLWAEAEAAGRIRTVPAEKIIAKILRDRKALAEKRVAPMRRHEAATCDAARRQLDAEVAAWSAKRLALAGDDAERRARIASNAQIRLHRGEEKLKPAAIPTSAGLPGKIIGRTALDLYRKQGEAAISAGLNRDGVSVW